ncbi:MAG TPA: hypothetical protein VJN18_16640 [Polyangiaceae bacterium]|nr:hypothetical protein [Polyangiaceae bacterium]
MRNGGVALALTAYLAAPSLSAEPSETDRSLAQSLFEQAKVLMSGGEYDQACSKLEESQRLDPGGGTLLNLAHCHELQGRVATSWTEFKEALSQAHRDSRPDRVAAAEEHISALEPKLPWLTLIVTSPVEGQEVKLDGVLVGRAAWGMPVAIDPGQHELSASAPSKQPFSQRLGMAISEQRTITIAALAAVQDSGTSARAPNAPQSTSTSQPLLDDPPKNEQVTGSTTRTYIGGAGGLFLILGAIAGLDALENHKESNKLCPTDTTCTKEGAQLEDRARTSAWISNVSLGLGVVGVATWFLMGGARSMTSQPHASHGLSVEAGADARGGGRVNLRGRF